MNAYYMDRTNAARTGAQKVSSVFVCLRSFRRSVSEMKRNFIAAPKHRAHIETFW